MRKTLLLITLALLCAGSVFAQTVKQTMINSPGSVQSGGDVDAGYRCIPSSHVPKLDKGFAVTLKSFERRIRLADERECLMSQWFFASGYERLADELSSKRRAHAQQPGLTGTITGTGAITFEPSHPVLAINEDGSIVCYVCKDIPVGNVIGRLTDAGRARLFPPRSPIQIGAPSSGVIFSSDAPKSCPVPCSGTGCVTMLPAIGGATFCAGSGCPGQPTITSTGTMYKYAHAQQPPKPIADIKPAPEVGIKMPAEYSDKLKEIAAASQKLASDNAQLISAWKDYVAKWTALATEADRVAARAAIAAHLTLEQLDNSTLTVDDKGNYSWVPKAKPAETAKAPK